MNTVEKIKLSDLTDVELVKQCQHELPYVTTAFEVLVNRYKRKIYADALHMLRHPQDAEDITQEIFLKIFDGINNFQFKSSFNTWLTAITKNACLTHIDKRKRSPWWWLTDDISEVQEMVRQDETMFEMVGLGLERQDLQDAIQKTLCQISEASREILILRFWDELDYQAIANKLNIKLSAAKMRLKRARQEFIQTFKNSRSN